MSWLFFAHPSRRLLLAGAFCLFLVLLPTTGNVRATSTSQTAPTPTQTAQPATGTPLLLTDPVPDSQQPGVQFFSATGHTLRGSFLDYWNNNGGLAQFGYPLTEEFTEPLGPNNSPVMVQYFERTRFEHHPENGAVGAPNEVLLGTLGRAFHAQDAAAAQLPAPADYFPQTRHNLSSTFQTYWHAHGGLAIYGYPITEQFQEQSPTDHKTYTVQYFERARMELHPENAGSPYEVLLGQLGTQLSQKNGYPYGWYPQYGQAADESWLAGKLVFRGQSGSLLTGGCAIFSYVEGARVQLSPANGPSIGPFPADMFVVFGHPTRESEHYYYCQADPAPAYIVERVQANPFRP